MASACVVVVVIDSKGRVLGTESFVSNTVAKWQLYEETLFLFAFTAEVDTVNVKEQPPSLVPRQKKERNLNTIVVD